MNKEKNHKKRVYIERMEYKMMMMQSIVKAVGLRFMVQDLAMTEHGINGVKRNALVEKAVAVGQCSGVLLSSLSV
jgi:hypothetical protein